MVIIKFQAERGNTINLTDNSHPCSFHTYNCSLIKNIIEISGLKPLELDNLNLAELDLANHKLEQYSRDLDGRINEHFVKKNIPNPNRYHHYPNSFSLLRQL